MVTPNWKSMTEKAACPDNRTRTVSGPIEHQGVRDALRGAFQGHDDMPPEFRLLLAKIR